MGTLLSNYKEQFLKEKTPMQRHRKEHMVLFRTILLLVIGGAVITPFLFMISASFKTMGEYSANPIALVPKEIYFGNYIEIFKNQNYFRWYGNSIKVVGIIMLLRLTMITTAAYAFAKLRFPFKNAFFGLLVMCLFIPSDTTLVSRYFIYKYMGIIDSHLAIILPGIADGLMLFMLRQFFMKIPMELTEAAYIDGCSHAGIFLRIIMPLTKPAVMTMMLFTFIWTWNNFTDPNIFISTPGNQLLTAGILGLTTQNNQPLVTLQLTGALLAILPAVLLFILVQRFFIQGIAQTGTKG